MRASRENQHWCHGCQKNAYRSTGAAQRVADRAFAERNVVLRWYYSEACGWVHLTTRSEWAEAAA